MPHGLIRVYIEYHSGLPDGAEPEVHRCDRRSPGLAILKVELKRALGPARILRVLWPSATPLANIVIFIFRPCKWIQTTRLAIL